jgi:hypothetical protein
MKFHIVITNNETGEVIKDTNADAIIASIHTEETTDVLDVACCNGFALVATIAGLMEALENNKKDHPKIYKYAKKCKKIKRTKEND